MSRVGASPDSGPAPAGSRRLTRRPAVALLIAGVLSVLLGVGSAGGTQAQIGGHSLTGQVQRAVSTARARLSAAAISPMTGAQKLTVSGLAFSPRAAVVVAQCSAKALAAALKAVSSALDYCDQHFVAVTATDASGSFSVASRAVPVIETASGVVDCRKVACLLGALNLGVLQGQPLQVAVLSLAFSPSANPGSAVSVTGSEVPPPGGRGLVVVTVKRAARTTVQALPAGNIGSGRVGQVVRLPAAAPTGQPIAGEGLLALTMSAPGTSWSNPSDTSVVVQARVDRGPWQAFVLFEGSRPFTYEGYTGPLRSGPHTVEVRVRRDLSQVADRVAAAVIRSQRLRVLSPQTAAGVELAHAPVLYDRRISATQDTPLLTYATDTRLRGGARRLSYVVTWSHEDAGTGFVPWLEWGTWGRMTDIESAISFTVDRHGRVSDSSYLSCVTCGPQFPENRTALDETDTPFRGAWYDGHPVLRVATGNNDFSDHGITKLRFQPALAAPPPAGDTREGAMDENPWTYDVMGAELRRDRADYSEAAGSAGPGTPQQYLIVQLDTAVQRAAAVGVELRFAGSARSYSNDLGTTYPLYDGGRGRTTVKVPLGLLSRPIASLTLRLVPRAAAPPSIVVHHIKVLQYVGGRIVIRRLPRLRVVTAPPPSPPPAGSSPSITMGLR